MLRQDDWQKSKLVDVMWQHGSIYGGHQAACIIGSCIMNRVRAGWSANAITAIASIPKFAASSVVPVYEIPSMFDPAFIRILSEVGAIYEGTKNYASAKGPAGPPMSALYWCDSRRIDTPFFREKILLDPSHKRIVEMNTLACYT